MKNPDGNRFGNNYELLGKPNYARIRISPRNSYLFPYKIWTGIQMLNTAQVIAPVTNVWLKRRAAHAYSSNCNLTIEIKFKKKKLFGSEFLLSKPFFIYFSICYTEQLF